MADIVLKDRDGNDVNHAVSTVRFKMSDGETKLFIDADTVQNVEGVHYVTFMSEDGTAELYKRAVLDGNDCADPVERGFIDTPAKEGDYYFTGWATEFNGAWDESALRAVTEDKIVYAAFASTIVGGGTFASTFTWELDIYGTLAVSGAGKIADTFWYDVGYVPWDDYRADIKSAVFSDGLTNVPVYAFQNCTALTSVTIPNSVTSIGSYAFCGCTALTSVTLPQSVTSFGGSVFYGCTALTSVDLGRVTVLGSLIFSGCTSLESITIPDSVTSIGNNCFAKCAALKSVSLPDSIKTIINNAFGSCTSLESITIPNSVTSIGTNAFLYCSALTSVTFADTTTWYVGASSGATTTQVDVTDPATNATYLVTTYRTNYWTKK